MRKIALSGLVALTAVFGGLAVPATAMAQPASGVHSPAVVARPAANPVISDVGGAKVSCVLTSDCVGIKGSSKLTGGMQSTPTRVARWNGTSWKGVGVALPKGTRSDDLLGVSCRGSKFCLVVGDYYKGGAAGSPSFPMALVDNGTSVKPTTAVPLPKGVSNAALVDVSCPTTRYCVAVGVADSGSGLSNPPALLETWNGATWTVHTIAASATHEVQPSAVSCATPTFCVVTGVASSFTSTSFSTGVYLASWNGKKLTTMKAPAPASAKDLLTPADVSCDTPGHCAVTGLFFSNLSANTPNIDAFTETWNGRTWQIAKATWPKGITQSMMVGVSCHGGHACETVGLDAASTANNAPADAAAVSYTGTTGTVQALPTPSAGHSTVFTAVSCLPWGTCVAVGETGKTTATTPSIMTGVWNGKAWKLEPGF